MTTSIEALAPAVEKKSTESVMTRRHEIGAIITRLGLRVEVILRLRRTEVSEDEATA